MPHGCPLPRFFPAPDARFVHPPHHRGAKSMSMITADLPLHDCTLTKPDRFHIVWLTYHDGFRAPGIWNGAQWWPVRSHGDPIRWQELKPRDLGSVPDDATTPPAH